MKKNIKLSVIALSLAMLSGMASADDSGLSVDEAQATAKVSAVVDSVISIKHVDDISFGNLSPGVNVQYDDELTRVDSICVYSNTEGFDLQLDSANPFDDFFSMVGENTGVQMFYTIGIDVYGYNDGDFYNNQVVEKAKTGSAYGPLYMNAGDENCSEMDEMENLVDGDNVQLTYTLSGADVFNSVPDTYTDTVTITARTVYSIGG